MSLSDLAAWAGLLNVLLIPGFVAIVRLRDDVRDASASLRSHSELDEQRFGEHRRDIDRIDRDVTAAHARLDNHGVASAHRGIAP